MALERDTKAFIEMAQRSESHMTWNTRIRHQLGALFQPGNSNFIYPGECLYLIRKLIISEYEWHVYMHPMRCKDVNKVSLSADWDSQFLIQRQLTLLGKVADYNAKLTSVFHESLQTLNQWLKSFWRHDNLWWRSEEEEVICACTDTNSGSTRLLNLEGGKKRNCWRGGILCMVWNQV